MSGELIARAARPPLHARVDYSVPGAGRIVLLTDSGPTTLADHRDVVDALTGNERLPEAHCLLVDARFSDSTLSAADCRELAGLYASLRAGGLQRIAVVARAEYIYGLARAFSAHAERFGLVAMAFRDFRSALTWLGEVDGG